MTCYYLVYGDKVEENPKVLLRITTMTLARAKFLASVELTKLSNNGIIQEPFTDYECLDLSDVDLQEDSETEDVESHVFKHNNDLVRYMETL